MPDPHLDITRIHLSLSFIGWVWISRQQLSPHVWRKGRAFSVSVLTKFDWIFRRCFWAALTKRWPVFLWFWVEEFCPSRPHLSAQKSRQSVDCWPALTVVRADHRLTVWPDFNWTEFDCFEGCFILLFGGRSWQKLTESLRVKSALLTFLVGALLLLS